MRHIYKQLDYLSQTALVIMFKNANIIDENIKSLINQTYQSCATCFIHRKAKARLKVSAPLLQNFNDIVFMDLKI